MFARKSCWRMQRKFAGCRNEGGTHQTQNGTNEQRSPKQKRKTKGKSNNKNCHKSFAIFICFFALRFFAKFSWGWIHLYFWCLGCASVWAVLVGVLGAVQKSSTFVCVCFRECVRMSGHKRIWWIISKNGFRTKTKIHKMFSNKTSKIT